MNVRDELIDRLYVRKLTELSRETPLSAGAREELRAALEEDPTRYNLTAADASFMQLERINNIVAEAEREDEFQDDETYFAAWDRRMEEISQVAQAALELNSHNVDARLILTKTQAPTRGVESILNDYEALVRKSKRVLQGFIGNVWDNPFARPHLRAVELLARAYVQTAHYRLAQAEAEYLLKLDPEDHLGARFDLALIYARLEDEPRLSALQAQFNNNGNPWFHLAQAVLLYKQGRVTACERALKGFSRLYESAAYAFLHPTITAPYLPDRPTVEPGSFAQLTQAVAEAEAIVVDCPDLIPLAKSLPTLVNAAKAFAKKYGFDL